MWLERVKTISFKQHKAAKGWTQHVERSRREVARNNVNQQHESKFGNEQGLGSGKSTGKRQRQEAATVAKPIALPGRLELPTLRLTASRSNQLSYGSHAGKLRRNCRGTRTKDRFVAAIV